jgi:hypothetical protein
MRICTSISPNRKERQQKCIASWLALGNQVIAVQSPKESSTLKRHYPEVEFVETDKVGDAFNRSKLVRISAILSQAKDDPILILNSDIEIRTTVDEFNRVWNPIGGNNLQMGIRWEEEPITKSLRLLKYGIDAFLITPKIVEDLNDIGMTMGCPAWDYWVPIHLQRKGYQLHTSKHLMLFHEIHQQNWNKQDFDIGVNLLKKHYGLTLKEASNFILTVTERTNL